MKKKTKADWLNEIKTLGFYTLEQAEEYRHKLNERLTLEELYDPADHRNASVDIGAIMQVKGIQLFKVRKFEKSKEKDTYYTNNPLRILVVTEQSEYLSELKEWSRSAEHKQYLSPLYEYYSPKLRSMSYDSIRNRLEKLDQPNRHNPKNWTLGKINSWVFYCNTMTASVLKANQQLEIGCAKAKDDFLKMLSGFERRGFYKSGGVDLKIQLSDYIQWMHSVKYYITNGVHEYHLTINGDSVNFEFYRHSYEPLSVVLSKYKEVEKEPTEESEDFNQLMLSLKSK